MSCIIYQTNKKNGHCYAYSAIAFRDPITRKPTSKRTYLGRVDPETKELLKPARKRAGQSEGVPVVENTVHTESQPMDQTLNLILTELMSLKQELSDIKSQMQRKDAILKDIGQQLTRYAEIP